MPSRKGLEQALTWLRSKMAEKDTLDAINAEVCYRVITDLREKKRVLGALYHQSYVTTKRAVEKLEQMKFEELTQNAEKERLYEITKKALAEYRDREDEIDKHGYIISNLTDEELEAIFPESGDSA